LQFFGIGFSRIADPCGWPGEIFGSLSQALSFTKKGVF
jgi:hypothetical protein